MLGVRLSMGYSIRLSYQFVRAHRDRCIRKSSIPTLLFHNTYDRELLDTKVLPTLLTYTQDSFLFPVAGVVVSERSRLEVLSGCDD
jgi:hypothetical protein